MNVLKNIMILWVALQIPLSGIGSTQFSQSDTSAPRTITPRQRDSCLSLAVNYMNLSDGYMDMMKDRNVYYDLWRAEQASRRLDKQSFDSLYVNCNRIMKNKDALILFKDKMIIAAVRTKRIVIVVSIAAVAASTGVAVYSIVKK